MGRRKNSFGFFRITSFKMISLFLFPLCLFFIVIPSPNLPVRIAPLCCTANSYSFPYRLIKNQSVIFQGVQIAITGECGNVSPQATYCDLLGKMATLANSDENTKRQENRKKYGTQRKFANFIRSDYLPCHQNILYCDATKVIPRPQTLFSSGPHWCDMQNAVAD